MSSNGPAWMSTFEERRRDIRPALDKLETGLRRLKSGDPTTMSSLGRLLHDIEKFNDDFRKSGGLRKLTENWLEETVETRATEILKELHLKDDKVVPTTAFVAEENEISSSPVSEQSDELTALPFNSNSAQSVVTFFANKMSDLNLGNLPQAIQQGIADVAAAEQSSSSSSVSSAAHILHNVVANAASMAEKVFQPLEQQPTLSGEDTQLAIDALHERLLHIPAEQTNVADKLGSLRLLKRLCITHDKLPRPLFLSDVVCDVAAGPRQLGSFSDIYWGTYRGQPAALKLLRAFQNTTTYRGIKLKKDFCREALIWAHSSKHPYVLPILGINDTCFKHGMCMVLPWMENGKIQEHIERLRDADEFADGQTLVDRWISQIAQGLASLHEEEIIHGDLRAGNVLVDENLNARVADFGLSTIAEDQLTRTTTRGRQPNWLAPELVDPASPSAPTKPSDVYAFGCVCIELYTGEIPFASAKSTWQVFQQIWNGDKPPRPTFYGGEPMADHLWSLVNKCFSTSPADRPTADEIAVTLSGLR